MEREPRPRKESDNDRIDEGIDLFYKMVDDNHQIEPTLWASVTAFILVNGYKNCGYTYEEFRQENDKTFEHYKTMFDGDCFGRHSSPI